MAVVTPLPPESFGRYTWNNGKVEVIDIASRYRDGAAAQDWPATLWRLGQTSIVEESRFSDLSGFGRLQVVTRGKGLTLHTDDGATHRDLTRAFEVVRYDGATKLTARIAAGPVEVLNLIYRVDAFDAELAVPLGDVALKPGEHVLYAPGNPAIATIDGMAFELPAGHALKIEGPARLSTTGGPIFAASLTSR
jgi:environmental stress-induced protein Ves